MVNRIEKRLYKVLRNVGVKPVIIKCAGSVDDLCLDDYDYQLLVYYFEKEFNVELTNSEITELTTLPLFYEYITHANSQN